MTQPTQEQLVRSYYLETLNTGRFEQLDALLSDDFVDHEALRDLPPTRDGLKAKYGLMRSGFSDFTFTIEDLVSQDDRIAGPSR